MTLALGSTLNPNDIKEGDDVYFECHIKANPKEHRITWSHDVSQFLPLDYIFCCYYISSKCFEKKNYFHSENKNL